MSLTIEREITGALLSYCRGIDRLDPEPLLAAFHPGADLIGYGPNPTTIEPFVDDALAALASQYRATQHRISNTTIDLDDSSATVETYVMADHVETDEDGGPDRIHTFNGRYIDRFEERDGRWLIAVRTLCCDWTRVETIAEPMRGRWLASGRGGTPDPPHEI